jgi:hypothetical protein
MIYYYSNVFHTKRLLIFSLSNKVNQPWTRAIRLTKIGETDLVFFLPGGWSHSAISTASDITAWRSAIALTRFCAVRNGRKTVELVIDLFALTFIFSECLCDKYRAICKSVLRTMFRG